MIRQHQFSLGPFPRGFHLITDAVLRAVGPLPAEGLLHLFVQHTSAGLTISENADPDVLRDFETYFNRIVPENIPGLRHTIEGPDDMPSHIKSSLTGSSVTIPITAGRLNFGTWQGIYFCEFRNAAGKRNMVATVFQ